jgi:hypothetical protein
VDLAVLTRSADDQLAQECSTLLGYTRPEGEVASRKLQAALTAEGIHPLTPESVQLYQTEMCQRKHWAPYQLPGIRHLLDALDAMPIWIGVICVFGTIVGLGLGVFGLIALVDPYDQNSMDRVFRLVGLGSLGVTALIIASHHRDACGGGWEEVDLKEYMDDIPSMLLHRSLSLKRRLPAATFTVQYWTKDARDPFLVIHLGEYAEIIGVWDERDFEPNQT